MPAHNATTIRFSPEDRELLAKLQRLTGLNDNASVIRFALRETLNVREALADRAAHGRKGGKRQ